MMSPYVNRTGAFREQSSCRIISSLASATTIPITEYLETSYRPDREYVDGELRERNVGKWERARVPRAVEVDPKTRTGRMCTGADWIAATRSEVPGTDLYVELEEIFSRIGSR